MSPPVLTSTALLTPGNFADDDPYTGLERLARRLSGGSGGKRRRGGSPRRRR
ncbi:MULTISPECIES: hypothetical protein [Streptomyces]|uniref:hypothetical protein n=1 Tax=Streptomyces TaxID=1883 RepID=UPI000180350E|nr:MULTISPECIES: hypothetical protein [Streptomyces]MYT10609.1 hypothetical protein [Streptomyces sp. SID5470]